MAMLSFADKNRQTFERVLPAVLRSDELALLIYRALPHIALSGCGSFSSRSVGIVTSCEAATV